MRRESVAQRAGIFFGDGRSGSHEQPPERQSPKSTGLVAGRRFPVCRPLR
jgi:hypothetical protein